MAKLRNRRKLAAVAGETAENTRNQQSQNTLSLGISKEYITKVSKKNKEIVTKKFSQKFIWTVSCILGALCKLDEILLDSQVRMCSVAVPGWPWNIDSENQEPNGDRFLKDPCPEVLFSASCTGILNDPEQEETHHSNYIESNF